MSGTASQTPYLPQFVELDIGLQLAKTNLRLRNRQDRTKLDVLQIWIHKYVSKL